MAVPTIFGYTYIKPVSGSSERGKLTPKSDLRSQRRPPRGWGTIQWLVSWWTIVEWMQGGRTARAQQTMIPPVTYVWTVTPPVDSW